MNVEEKTRLISEDSLAFLTQDKYTMNPDLDKEYKNLTSPVSSRIKNALVYNTCMVFGYYYFSRNAVYFRKKKYKGLKDTSNLRILRSTLFYTFIPALLLAPNVFILFGLHPLRYFREKKALEDQLLGSSELKDSIFGVNKMYRKDIATTMTESEETLMGKK
jgi:hypothetical protein